MLLMCLATAFSVTKRAAAIAAFDRPSAISAEHLLLARRQPVERLVAAAGHDRGDDLGVEDGAAGGDAAYAVDELGDVGDAVLEQVADRALAAGQQLAGVELLDELGQHHHREAGPRLADGDRRAQALVGLRRRQAYVEHGGLGGRVLSSAGSRSAALSTACRIVKPLQLEELDQAGPEEGVVFGEDKAHGTSRVTMVGPAGRARHPHRAVEGGQPPHDPRMPVPASGSAPPTAVVADDRPQHARRRGPA